MGVIIVDQQFCLLFFVLICLFAVTFTCSFELNGNIESTVLDRSSFRGVCNSGPLLASTHEGPHNVINNFMVQKIINYEVENKMNTTVAS